MQGKMRMRDKNGRRSRYRDGLVGLGSSVRDYGDGINDKNERESQGLRNVREKQDTRG